MRVAIFPPTELEIQNCAGILSRIYLLAEELIGKGIDVTIVGTSGFPVQSKSVPARLFEIPDALGPELASHWRMSSFLECAGEFDLAHNYGGHLPVVYSELLNTPVLTTIEGVPSKKVLPIYQKFSGRTFYVSTSRAARTEGLAYLETVYPGIAYRDFEFQEVSGDYLVFAGDIKPENDLEEATAIAKASERRLIIAGAVPDKHFAVEMSDSGLIESKKRVDAAGLKSLLKNAYCLVNPSCEIAVLEANAHGTPVLAFRRGSIPELITEGVNGFVVSDVAEAVQAIERMRHISRKRCRDSVEERFSISRMADDYLGIYSRILSKTQREELRPWGHYTVLSDLPDHKVKRIHIFPGKRLSLQRHRYRSEHWVIVSGRALVTLNSATLSLGPGQSVDIPLGAVHRIQNPCKESLVFVEVQMGEYFGEDDIERLEDDFQRT